MAMVDDGPWIDRLTTSYKPWSRRRAAAWWMAAAVLVFGIGLIAGKGGNPLIDLKVYRDGGISFMKNLPLYTTAFPRPLAGPNLPFTYPPFAAVVFSVLGFLGYYLAAILMVAIGFTALTWTFYLVLRSRAGARFLPEPTPRVLVTLTLLSLVMEPISSTFLHGQINLLLMGLVVTDALGPKTRIPRGVLAGIAAAIKLTPAVFLLYFVARRQWKTASNMAAAFVGATSLSFILAPRDSRAYWTETVFDPTRIGDLGYAANQSLRGGLHRLGGLPGLAMSVKTEEHLWLALSMAVIALAYLGARRAIRHGDPVCALAVVAACQLLISPVSWSHHWVWIAPMLLPFAIQIVRARERLKIAGLALLALVFLIGPLLLFPVDHGLEMHWGWWENVIGDAYLLITLAFVVWAAVTRRNRPAPVAAGLPAPRVPAVADTTLTPADVR
ncbi:glycosyltransferase 87 family protein [Catenulispora pinisilvae]|uniref:glycosyltransferase 87 family protein n=1 Tax=Catenulispora pinisilvae TaxID=2705253 RepID=UPI001890F58E|nr:glycosyltransferase 87 family protein [Catenulispora pinisilvae]